MGNATQAEALALVDTVEAALASTGARAAQPEVLPLPRHVQAPLGVSALQTRNLNPEQENAALLLTLQLGERTTTTGALAQLLASMLHEPLFDQLRTKQQVCLAACRTGCLCRLPSRAAACSLGTWCGATCRSRTAACS